MTSRRPTLPRTYDDLLARYYGAGPAEVPPALDAAAASPRAIAMSRDDGTEVLGQPEAGAAKAPAAAQDEYVVVHAAAPAPAPTPAPPQPAAAAPPVPAPAEAPTAPAAAPAPAPAQGSEPAPAPAPPPALEQPASRGGGVDEEELAADMKAILSGHKVYDPATGQTVERGAVAPPPAPAQQQAPPPAPSASGEQSIFDRIAESMQYANAYDLGAVDLDDRFSDFDRFDDLRSRREDRGAPAPAADVEGTEAPAAPSPSEFLHDMDAIRGGGEAAADDALRRAAEAIPRGFAHATCLETAVALSAAPAPAYAQPMYDTGEHVRTAESLYPDQLLVGHAPGVPFSYGQIVAMPDLFASVEQMMGTGTGELQALKALIERSTAFYRNNHTGPDVSNAEWDHATGGRYLELAEDNFTHFAPNDLITDAAITAAIRHGNHKAAWEAHHRRALDEARRATGTAPPLWALTINAFGDHFLTDAFASGHLVNKDVVVALFKAAFLHGGELTDAATAFFGRVATAAFVGPVREKFSRLETSTMPRWHGIPVMFHPNINSADRFAEVLKGACRQQPDRVANLAVKALHDRLNADGVEVTNAAGDPAWHLTGDGHLTDQTLAIMRRAVQQSVDNVNDPALRGGGAPDYAAACQRVWRHTPILTPASRTAVVALIHEYTNPASTVLSAAAAQLVTDQVDSLIDVLVNRQHVLRPA